MVEKMVILQINEYIDPKPGREYMHMIFMQKDRKV
jgi:hypothetical protein